MELSDETFKKLSHSIATTRFPLVFSILLLHAYTAVPMSGHALYFKTIYPFAIWFGETGVPAYFFISALLLFYSSKTYTQQLKSRVRTLLIPYLIWNGMMALIYIAAWLVGHEQLILHRSLSDYGLTDYLRLFIDRGEGKLDSLPILTPMWYIRDLMVMYLLSPIIYYAIRTTHLLLPAIFCYLWITDHSAAFTYQCLAMFTLGAAFPILDINPLDFMKRFKMDIIILFAVFGFADLFTHIVVSTPVNAEIHRISLMCSIFFVIWLGIYLYDKGVRFPYLSRAAFFVFCIHYPINTVIRKVLAHNQAWPDVVHIVLYIVSVAMVTAICLGIYELLRRYAPRFLNVSTGSRG